MKIALLKDFDAWRDATVEDWQAAGASRPRRPAPRPDPPALRPPLGLVRADWGRNGQHDERLQAGTAPWVLPSSVTIGGQPSPAGLRALAKRRAYAPAGWPEERDDLTWVSGLVVVRFPAVEQIAGLGELAFDLRLNRPAEITLDGQATVLYPLGVNARLPPAHERPRHGGHPYFLSIPGRMRPARQPLEFLFDFGPARCSRLLLARTTGNLEI